MRMNEVTFNDAKPIDGYGPGFFRIAGDVIEGPVLLSPFGQGAWGGYEDPASIAKLAGEVDVIFVGTGAEIAYVPQAFREAIESAGLGLEAMPTAPACRTYNVLLSEGRRIAAALLPV